MAVLQEIEEGRTCRLCIAAYFGNGQSSILKTYGYNT
uniref:Uncharacterized protein n=1 Tax=Oryza sativa subsp. japonica TaxID=39947 RepID=Q109A7_ORYSJ|nr:hypothetical protein LOC_Os10g39764 [Oryza sativa Japonica Group]